MDFLKALDYYEYVNLPISPIFDTLDGGILLDFDLMLKGTFYRGFQKRKEKYGGQH